MHSITKHQPFLQIKIKACPSGYPTWYYKHIDELFPAKENDGVNYEVYRPDGKVRGYVNFLDLVVISK